MILADASNEFAGQWIYILGGVCANIIIALIAILTFFATKRDVQAIEKRLDKQDEDMEQAVKTNDESYRRLDKSDEARISGIHNRLNPLEISTANLQGQMTAFTMSFEKFTRIIESTSRAREDQTSAFIQALDTFARVCADKEHK